MIKFKDLATADKDIIQSFTLHGARHNCDLSFANLISWRFNFNTQWAIYKDFLLFRFHTGRHLAYMMPIPKPKADAEGKLRVTPEDECDPEVIQAIREDSIAMGHPFLMMDVCNYMVDILEKHFPDVFDIKPNRDYADYIYEREKLINLSGKKLQSKRNHINKFKNLYPNYEYKPLTPDLIPECIRLEKQWRDVSKDDGNENDLDESLSGEFRSMIRAFNRWDRLGLIGGTIWVDGNLVAFTYGCPINDNTFDVCVEKADVNYEGAFNIINQEFVKHLPEQYFYINREEDMGEEGLRRAKLSYKPDILLEKNVVMEKHPLAVFEEQDRIFEETRQLWKTVFNDSDDFINLYFSKVYQPKYNITCQIDRHVVAALQTLPFSLHYKGNEVSTAYMSGVCVNPDYRRRNIGNNLMRQAHFDLYYKGAVYAVLIPADDWLKDWYTRCGYSQHITCIPEPADVLNLSFEAFDAIQRKKPCALLHSAESYAIAQEDIRIAGNKYQPHTDNVVGMIRIINAQKALSLYAEAHPQQSLVFHIEDDRDIPMNNAYYVMEGGKVKLTDEPYSDALRMSIGELSSWLFQNEQAEMCLMMN